MIHIQNSDDAFIYIHKNPILNNIRDTEILPSSIHGFGLFSKKSFLKHELLLVLDGQKVPWGLHALCTHISDAGNEWNILEGNILLFRPYRTKYSFINHSRSPNLELYIESEKLQVRALDFITVNTELTLDYRKEPLPDEYLKGHGATYL